MEDAYRADLKFLLKGSRHRPFPTCISGTKTVGDVLGELVGVEVGAHEIPKFGGLNL